jgi:hypothetical protein
MPNKSDKMPRIEKKTNWLKETRTERQAIGAERLKPYHGVMDPAGQTIRPKKRK